MVYLKIKRPIVPPKKIVAIVAKLGRKLKKTGVCSVHLVGPTTIKKMNLVYRWQNRVTDVLSFAIAEEFKGEKKDWGDIFICQERIIKQAKEFGVSPKEELARMLTHGVLHLLGYDHQKPAEAKRMFSLQEKLLKELV